MDLEAKFTLEIEKCGSLLRHLSRRASPRAHREPSDLTQEILLNAWKSYPNFRGDSKFSTWLYRIGLLTLFQDYRKKSMPVVSVETVVERQHPMHELQSNIDEDLRRMLPDNTEYLAFKLYVDGYTYEEISRSLGITANHVGVKIHRVRKRLQKCR